MKRKKKVYADRYIGGHFMIKLGLKFSILMFINIFSVMAHADLLEKKVLFNISETAAIQIKKDNNEVFLEELKGKLASMDIEVLYGGQSSTNTQESTIYQICKVKFVNEARSAFGEFDKTYYKLSKDFKEFSGSIEMMAKAETAGVPEAQIQLEFAKSYSKHFNLAMSKLPDGQQASYRAQSEKIEKALKKVYDTQDKLKANCINMSVESTESEASVYLDKHDSNESIKKTKIKTLQPFLRNDVNPLNEDRDENVDAPEISQ